MKIGRSAGLLLCLCMVLTGATTAFAHETPSPSPVSTPLSELEQYKLDLEQYRIDMNLREQVRKEIAKAFVAAIKAADSIAKSALRVAKGDKAKTIILDQQQSAKVEAILIRDQALEAMGDAPIEPTKPAKPAATAVTKKTKTAKPSPTSTP